MQHIYVQDRDQIHMVSLGETVEDNSMVHIIDAFVDMLDLLSFHFPYFDTLKLSILNLKRLLLFCCCSFGMPHQPSEFTITQLYGTFNTYTCRIELVQI